MEETLCKEGVDDYRLKLKPCSASGDEFKVSVAHSKPSKTGPRAFERCLSCDPDEGTVCANNYPQNIPDVLPERLRAITTSQCQWTFRNEFPGLDPALVCVWLDAQGRPLMIVTPRRYLGGMEDMSDEEVQQLWLAVGLVVDYMRPEGAKQSFEQVVLNVGKFRNIEHAHVKVWLHAKDFLERVSRWPSEKQTIQRDLQELRRLMKIPQVSDASATIRLLSSLL
jgi:diadenosine tetraphosphate (Ap4A) HIT family hydrolase